MRARSLWLLLLLIVATRAQNEYYRGADRDEVVGGWGGTCTCPDGETQYVGDNLDGCKSIACVGGVAGKCTEQIPPEARGMKFVCEGATPAPTTPQPTLKAPDAHTLVWSDEFDGDSLDPSKWRLEDWPPRRFNDELEHYSTNGDNIQVKNGTLTITAKAVDGNVTSARLTTAGNFRFTYGRVLIRARLPEAPASWPAFWLLGTRPGLEWPDCGEIDILEKMGHLNYHMACGAVHNGAHNFLLNASGKRNPSSPPLAYGCKVLNDLKPAATESGWHEWELEWKPEGIKIYIDSYQIFEYKRTPEMTRREWPYDAPFFFIVNLAICGAAFWNECDELVQSGALEGDGVEFIIDHVRVYQDSREIWFQTAPWTVPWFQEIPTMTRRHIPSWKAWALAFVVVNVAACVMWKLERGRPDASEDRSFY